MQIDLKSLADTGHKAGYVEALADVLNLADTYTGEEKEAVYLIVKHLNHERSRVQI